MCLKPASVEALRAWYASKPLLQSRINYSLAKFDSDWRLSCGLLSDSDISDIKIYSRHARSVSEAEKRIIFEAECRMSQVMFFAAVELLGLALYWSEKPLVFGGPRRVH